jgi:DNA-binding MarR family transcriptional regulator
VKAVRRFNRFYTQRIGVLDPYLGSEFSLTEVRVLYELAHRDQPTATELGRDLSLDAGYLSRILRRFESKGWLARVPSVADGRQSLLKLTEAGHAVFAPLQQQSRDEAATLLAALAPGDQQKIVRRHGHRGTAAGRAGRPCRHTHRDPARPAARRHGLGGATARRDLCARVRLEQRVRSAGGRHRRQVPQKLPAGLGKMLDRGDRR